MFTNVSGIYCWDNGDYYELTDDIEKYDQDSNGKIVANED
jgi:hypothetical protein